MSDVTLSKDAEKILEMVESLSVLDLANLVKAMEDKFGVSAAAPVMMAGAAPAGVYRLPDGDVRRSGQVRRGAVALQHQTLD